MTRCIALMVAAPASGQGKTSVTAGLAQHLRQQGRHVRAFKWGPDFLDPSWLAAASGNPVHNLDLAMCGAHDVASRLADAAAHADVVLIESAMGLFDGTPCAADLAQRFDIPILLVMDASHMAETFGALAHGLARHRPGLRFAGVLANRVGSARHAELLQSGLDAGAASGEPGLPWLGSVARQTETLPARQLGLIASQHVPDADARLAQLANALASTALGQMPWAAWARWQVTLAAPTPTPAPAQYPVKSSASTATATTPGATAAPAPVALPTPSLAGTTIAVAHDAAFAFIYPANLACLTQLGAKLAIFSPLAGDPLPHCDALWLPGGYPELHAQTLAQQHTLRAQLHAHVAQGKPIWAECGGMVALAQGIAWPSRALNCDLWGLLPGWVTQHERLQGLGMQGCETPLGLLRGHGFHYSRFDTPLAPVTRTHRLQGEHAVNAAAPLEAVYVHGSVRASYFHAWFASNPAATAALFSAGGLWPHPAFAHACFKSDPVSTADRD